MAYPFHDLVLQAQAFRHSSCETGESNERLEFLGDAILGAVMAELLYHRYPDQPEGVLSRLRAALVNTDRLASWTDTLGWVPHIQVGHYENRALLLSRPSVLADVFEAYVGALYLDGGYEVCRTWLTALYEPLLQAGVALSAKDAKTRLQEWLQKEKRPLPVYVIASAGPSHAPHFVAECQIDGFSGMWRGEGRSRRRAEQAAAEAFLKEHPDV